MNGCSPHLSVTKLTVKCISFPGLSCEPKIKVGKRVGGHSARGWLYSEIMVIVPLVVFLLCRHGRQLSE